MVIKSIITPFNNIGDKAIDIVVNEINGDEYKSSTLIEIFLDNSTIIGVLFNFLEKEEIIPRQFYIANETATIFFMTNNQLGIIDLNSKKIIELKNSFTFGMPERVKNSVIFDDELTAKSYSLNGDFIGEVPIDPPSERKDFNDYLEYNSPIFGKRKLKIT